MKMSKKGARSVTAALDNLATLFQQEAATLGVPARVAKDFAYRCDLLSDRVERVAGISRRALTELDVNKEKGFDPELIGEEVTGPLEGDGDESFMKAEFTQQENRELRERIQDGDLGMKTNMEPQSPQGGKQASVNSRLASACGDLMKASSTVNNGVMSSRIAKLASLAIDIHRAASAGLVSEARAKRTLMAITHVIPSIGKVKDLNKLASIVALAYKIVSKKSEDDAEGEEAPAKEAGKKGEIPPQFLENVNKKKDEAKGDDKEDDKKDDGKEDKKASHGFKLFA